MPHWAIIIITSLSTFITVMLSSLLAKLVIYYYNNPKIIGRRGVHYDWGILKEYYNDQQIKKIVEGKKVDPSAVYGPKSRTRYNLADIIYYGQSYIDPNTKKRLHILYYGRMGVIEVSEEDKNPKRVMQLFKEY